MVNLNVSEYFYSIQGEGQYQGYPALFFRLQNCNLFCGRPTDSEYKEKAPGCKWVCDTIAVWMEGEPMTNKDVIDKMEEKGYIEKLKEGAHLILTGGEPLLQQNGLVDFVNEITQYMGMKPYVEVETNGTITPTEEFDNVVDRYNVSAKLQNSGNPKPLRYKPQTLQYHRDNPKSIFKFVTLDNEDTNEILEDFVKPFDIPREKIWLMPGAYDREELQTNSPAVAELCKKYGYRMSTRMHVEIWNKLTGV